MTHVALVLAAPRTATNGDNVPMTNATPPTNGARARSIADNQARIVAEFAAIPEWEDRTRHIIELGRQMPPFPEAHRIDANKVKGCQSQVWMHAWLDETTGHVRYLADSDAHIVRGLLALLLRAYDDHTPEAIVAAPADFIDAVGLNENLSQNRAFGMLSVLKQMKFYAIAFKALRDRRATS